MSAPIKTTEERLQGIEQKKYEKMLEGGRFRITNRESKIKYGREVLEVTATDTEGRLSGKERVKKVLAGVLPAMVLTPLVYFDKGTREKVQKGIKNEVVRKETFANLFVPGDVEIVQSEEQPDEAGIPAVQKKVGYNPKIQSTVAEYASRPENKAKMMEYHGHLVLPEHRRGKISSFIFCPNGDTSKAVSIKIWDSGSGNSISDSAKYMLAMRDYCASYNDVEKAIIKAAGKLEEEFRKAEAPLSKEEIAKALKALPIEINQTNEAIYVHSHHTAGARTGISLDDISKDTWKNINRAHNKKETEMKQQMEGDKPMKHLMRDQNRNAPNNAGQSSSTRASTVEDVD